MSLYYNIRPPSKKDSVRGHSRGKLNEATRDLKFSNLLLGQKTGLNSPWMKFS